MRPNGIPSGMIDILQINRDGVIVCDEQGKILFFNEACNVLLNRNESLKSKAECFDDLESVSSHWRKRIFWKDLLEELNEHTFQIALYLPSIHKNFQVEIIRVALEGNHFIMLFLRDVISFYNEWNDEFILQAQQKLMDELPIMIAGLDRVGVFKFVNLEMMNVLKMQRCDVLNNNDFIDTLIPNPKKRKETIEKVLREENGFARPIQLEVINGIGQERSIQMFVIYNPQSSVKDISYWLVGSDNTAFQKALLSLVESEERYSFISKVSNDAVWDWDLVTDKLWWNEGMTSIFGYSPDEVENTYHWWITRVHPSYIHSVNESLQMHVKEKRDFWSHEYLFLRKDGTYAFVYDKGYLVKDERGKAIRFVGGMVDITGTKNTNDL